MFPKNVLNQWTKQGIRECPDDLKKAISSLLFAELMIAFRRATGQKPQRIIFYRDGHHHARLFANNHQDRRSVDRSGNILPGTVVDSKICHLTEFDFYLGSRVINQYVLFCSYARCTRSVSIVTNSFVAGRGGADGGGRTTPALVLGVAVRPLSPLKDNVKKVLFYY
ncbi:hypothetical protein ACFE04_023523 [Oxalis oulophora]